MGELIREIVASELERIGDERLDLVTITSVTVDGSLEHAAVYYSALQAEADGRLDDVAEALDELRWPVQQVVNREVRARKTPQIEFRPDDVLLSALRVEEILRTISDGEAGDDPDRAPGSVDGPGAPDAAAGTDPADGTEPADGTDPADGPAPT